jgi:ribosomal protein S12 methylthiotransferase
MDRFAGQTLEVLIEERIASGDDDSGDTEASSESLWLGRLYCQAPEIDGAAVIVSDDSTEHIKPQAGTLVPCKVVARRGFDLQVGVAPPV